MSATAATIKIRPILDGTIGPLLGPFTIESAEGEARSPLVTSVLRFNRWVAGGMSVYSNKSGIENSSLFKSYAMECFEELARDDPDAAASLTGLVVICSELPPNVEEDVMWRLHRAILASLPGTTFVD